MHLVKFSIKNFRSIINAHNIPISNTTVLVGKNNEGKSNILRGLSFAMNAITEHASKLQRSASRSKIPYRYYSFRRNNEKYYNWERDFPIIMQEGKGRKETVFKLEFELNDEETKAFKHEIQSSLNGTLPLKITIGENNIPEITVSKGGRANKSINSKSDKIAGYIAKRITFNYIPAIRTHEQTIEVIDELLAAELRQLESNSKYKEALATIAGLQEPILIQLSERIKGPLSEFLPNIRGVQIEIGDVRPGVRHRQEFEVIIDDGTPTSIEHKGDGVKSLAALGLLKNKSYQSDASIIAIEEPESHLHPGAIHQLVDIVRALEKDNQVVITTHNPLFVNRRSLHSNILVDEGNAMPAKQIDQIRNILGVKVSDNLTHARFILVVEGEEDKVALTALLSVLSVPLSSAFDSHLLVIDSLGGAGNLPYKLSTLRSQLALFHVFLDYDDAGKRQAEQAVKEGLLTAKGLTQTICNGMTEAEFEDCLALDAYKVEVEKEFGITLDCTEFRGNEKWSSRLRRCFLSQGKRWSDEVKAQLKKKVAECVMANPKIALSVHKRGSIDSLVRQLESLFAVTLPT